MHAPPDAAVASETVPPGVLPEFAAIGLTAFLAGVGTLDGAIMSEPIELPASFAMLPCTANGIGVSVTLAVAVVVAPVDVAVAVAIAEGVTAAPDRAAVAFGDIGITVGDTGVAAHAVDTTPMSANPTAVVTMPR